MLPDIHIEVSEKPEFFLQRILEIAAGGNICSAQWCNEPYIETGARSLHLRLLSPSQHAEAQAKLLIRPSAVTQIQVELYAEEWAPDPPTRQTYCELAVLMLKPLVDADNHSTGFSYKLKIQPKPRSRPPFSSSVAERFERFATLANKASLHPLDWERFYDFVRLSRKEVPEGTVQRMLINNGFSADRADRIANIYHHLMVFKSKRRPLG